MIKIKFGLFAILSLILVGCGGGSSSDQAPAATNTPVANAGSNQNVTTGTTVSLDGTASTAPDNGSLTYTWSFTSFPNGSAATLDDANSPTPEFVADIDGEYNVQLTVNDGQTNSDPDSVTIIASSGNSAPVANAGTDQSVNTGNLVNLDGSGSSDADSDPITYSWSFASRPAGSAATLADANTASPTFTPDVDGGYDVRLVVNDGTTDSDADQVTVSAAAGNSPPMANAGPDQNVAAGGAVTLDGSASSDADGDLITYQWTTVSIPAGSSAALDDSTSAMPTFTADVNGDYVYRLVVNDGTVDSAADTVTVTAASANTAPVADAGPDQNVNTGIIVNLDGSGSSDANADALTYAWTFVSMPSGSSASLSNAATVSPAFTPDVDGDYVLRLIVNDGTVDSTPDTIMITATTANSVPVADAGPDQNVGTGDLVTLNGGNSNDADGDPLTYSWSFVSRPSGSSANLSDASAVSPSFTADVTDSFVLQLVVNDGMADSTSDQVSITAAQPDITLIQNGFSGPREVGLPFSSTGSQDIIVVGGNGIVELGSFQLRATGSDFTVTNLSAIDSNGVVVPFFGGLASGTVISDGAPIDFTLNSPLTNGGQADLRFQFTIAETGDAFSSRILLRTN